MYHSVARETEPPIMQTTELIVREDGASLKFIPEKLRGSMSRKKNTQINFKTEVPNIGDKVNGGYGLTSSSKANSKHELKPINTKDTIRIRNPDVSYMIEQSTKLPSQGNRQ